jgi:hypothetical protein
MECCNAKRDGKCLRYRNGWESKGLNSEDLRRAFEKRVQMVIDDVGSYPFEPNGLQIVQDDARSYLKKIRSKSYDLVITSPPYLNSFDYSDVYRPELFIGGFVKSNDELREIRHKTIRSHVQVKWTPSSIISSPLIPPILEKMNEGKLWNPRLPAMVQSYFADMADILRETFRVVRKNGQAWLVVSTSAYGGVEIPVDLILADIATREGWKLRGVYVLRQLRAAGQQWAHIKPGGRSPLRESLIILDH